MKVLKLSVLIILITLVSCDSLNPFANKKEKMKNLEGTWYLESYELDGQAAELTALEQTSYLNLKSGKLFECLKNGEKVNGDWDYYMMTETISLMEEGELECIEYDVVEATEDKLIYEYETDSGSRMKVWMTSTQPATDPVSPE